MGSKELATPRDRSRRRRKPTDTDALSGRSQIIEAAIASILEVGFYRSSTNEIARRADVSWGALQYHFGTREALLLAVLQELDRRYVEAVQDAQIVGETPEERIASLYKALGPHYDSPLFLVRLQIVLNLQHDPDTSDDVMREIAENAAHAEAPVRRLLRETIGGRPTRAEMDSLFTAVRGYALSRQLARAVPIEGSSIAGPEALKVFLRGLAAARGSTARR
jgi:AcrR family transcriptional regulator